MSTIDQSEYKQMYVTGAKRGEERACNQNTIAFRFASHWLRKCGGFCQPITERSNAKPTQTRNCARKPLCKKAFSLRKTPPTVPWTVETVGGADNQGIVH